MKKRQRKNIRLQGYDYGSEGAYFLTICVYQRECCLSKVISGDIQLTEAGKIVEAELLISEQIRDDIFIDEYVIMPNHIHLIVLKSDTTSPVFVEHETHPQTEGFASRYGPQRDNIPAFIRAFKSMATRKIRGKAISYFKWQPRFHDRIIRNQEELVATRTYIRNNPANWDDDPENKPWE